ncbi:helix-turn-helix transcriptional regulator [Lachnospiraceae bacterium 48-33]
MIVCISVFGCEIESVEVLHRQITKATGISATTLYSIIQRDSNIRFDLALRLANKLEIDVNEIAPPVRFPALIPYIHLCICLEKTVCPMWIICSLLFIN